MPGAGDRTVIVGAGPAGLTAAYELTKSGWPETVLEQSLDNVGGLSRTVEFKGFRFDIGGHRFFSKNKMIEELWTEILGDRMTIRRRLSRIYYRGRLFRYPLEPLNVLRNLGLYESIACGLSFMIRPRTRPEEIKTFEDWVTRAFGRRLYSIFFKTYTEKVWGIPCNEISADWAAQRIRGLTLAVLIRNLIRRQRSAVVKTLIDSFRYPPEGPGEMWRKVSQLVQQRGGEVSMGESVVGIHRSGGLVRSVTARSAKGERTLSGSHFISTMPIRNLMGALDPPAPPALLEGSKRLRYRDFLVVALIIDQADVFPDQWIYVHEPGVQVGRIQNFKNWSPEMVTDPRYTVLGLEYFCSQGDALWETPDDELIARARGELASLKLVDPSRVVEGTVVRQLAAYPVYDAEYRASVDMVREFAASELRNLHLAGRNGMHKYDNQDHAMMTGLIAAWNIMGGSYDAWRVNSDAEYLEAGEEDFTPRMIPQRVA